MLSYKGREDPGWRRMRLMGQYCILFPSLYPIPLTHFPIIPHSSPLYLNTSPHGYAVVWLVMGSITLSSPLSTHSPTGPHHSPFLLYTSTHPFFSWVWWCG